MAASLPSTTRRLATAVALAALLGGCAGGPPATIAWLTYETSPAGATLYEGGQALGAAPVRRSYEVAAGASTVRTPLVTAVWPSGAKESYYTVLPVGSDRVATIERPASAPGLQADLENAKKLAGVRAQDSKREQEAIRREQAQNSARCRAQQASGGPKAGIDDCM